MGLDGLRRAAHATRFDHVRIKRALHQPVDLANLLLQPVRFAVKDFNELIADDLAFLFRINDASELADKYFASIDRDHVQAKSLAEAHLNFLEFVLAQHAVVDEDGDQAASNSAVNQRGRHRRVHAAGESADCPSLLAHGLSHLAYGFINEVLRGPAATRAADRIEKGAHKIDAALGVVNFRMELHGPYAAGFVLHRGQSGAAPGNDAEAAGQFKGLVAMGHPNVQGRRQIFEQPRLPADRDFRVSILAPGAGTDLAAELVGDEVQSVADAEHRKTQGEDAVVGGRSVVVIDRRRPSTQNDARRTIALDFVKRGAAGQDDGENFQFADAAGNELRVLRAEIENNNGLVFHEQFSLIRGGV